MRPLGSTYRLQLAGVGLDGARRLVPYLDRLGIETLYVSPLLAAVPGSTHGYDVTDPTRVDPALGTADDLEALLGELDAHRMRLLVDIVPNHLAASSADPWWWETLRSGRAAPHAGVFDIDWSAHDGRVLLPVLGRPLAAVLAAGELTVVAGDAGDGPQLAYFDARFPLDPVTTADLRPGDPDVPVEGAVLAKLLDRQHYRLAHWRLGRRQGNYRRFFDVDGLVGVRVEDPDVYRATHRWILDLVADVRVAGLRVDHVDGLADPTAYLDRLRSDADRARGGQPAVLLVEKILGRAERPPRRWPVDGTTGYEFADLVGGLWIHPSAAEPGFRRTARAARREVMSSLLPGQVDRIAREVVAAVDADGPGTDLDPADTRRAVVELTAQLDAYRTYLGTGPPDDADRRRLERAALSARPHLDAEGTRALGLLVDGFTTDPMTPSWEVACRRWQQLTGAVAAKGVEDTALYRTTGTPAAAEVGGDPGDPAVGPDAFHRAMTARADDQPHGLSATTTHDTKWSEDVRARLAVLTEWRAGWWEQVRTWERRHRVRLGEERVPDPGDERRLYAAAVGIWPAAPDLADLRDRLGSHAVKAARESKCRTSWLEPDEGYEHTLVAFVDSLLGAEEPGFVDAVERVVEMIGPAAAVNGLSTVALKATAPGVPDVYQGCETWSRSLVDPDNRRPVAFGALDARLSELDGVTTATELLRRWRDGQVKLDVTRRLLHLRRAEPALFDCGAYLPLEVRGERADHLVAFARHRDDRWSVTVVPRLVLTVAGPGRMPTGGAVWGGTAVQLPPGAPDRLVGVLTGDAVPATAGWLPAAQLLGEFPVSVLVPEART